jgi:hypothetical protein
VDAAVLTDAIAMTCLGKKYAIKCLQASFGRFERRAKSKEKIIRRQYASQILAERCVSVKMTEFTRPPSFFLFNPFSCPCRSAYRLTWIWIIFALSFQIELPFPSLRIYQSTNPPTLDGPTIIWPQRVMLNLFQHLLAMGNGRE